MSKGFCIVVMIILGGLNLVYGQTSKIIGTIHDADSREKLLGANVLVQELDNVGAASDENGNFEIIVPVGSYSLKITLLGYQTVIKTDVIVRTGRETHINVEMMVSPVGLNEVTVVADYFDKAKIENDLSTIVLGIEEIKRSPGSSQDFQRILQSMAGVTFSTDQNNELLVRGGSPDENLTVFDHIELHSTNHYPNDFNSGGPINMVNTELIEDIQFSTGGFISKYGDKLSSVMNITSREGTRNSLFNLEGNLSMAGAGIVAEGALAGGNGSWVLSARKSYIDLIAGSVGLTAIPKYWDTQFKVVYDLNEKHKLSWSGIYGNDVIVIDGESDEEKPEKANTVDDVDIRTVDVKQYQYASGITLRSLWRKNLYSFVTAYVSNYHDDVSVNNDYTKEVYDANGKVMESTLLSTKKVFDTFSDKSELGLKTEFVWKPADAYEINFGGALKFGHFKQNIFIDADTARYDFNQDGIFDYVSMRPEANSVYDFKWGDQHKSYVYANNKFQLFNNRVTVNAGLRYDYFSYSEKGNLSPRLSLSYAVVPTVTHLNFSYGEFYQTQNYPTYGDRLNSDLNRYLNNSHARHYVAGIEHIFDDGFKMSIEGYYKKYSDIPVSEEFIHFDDRTFRSDKLLNIGERETYGIDLFMQKKLVDDWYGTLSFSRMWSKMDDPRLGYEGNTYSSDYDYPYVFTIIAGKRFSNLRSNLDKMPFFIKYPSYILPFSDDMEISFKWRYASGRPYTQKIYTEHEQYRVGGVHWTDGSWISSNEINGARYPDYHRLDLTFYSRFNFSSYNLVVFFEVQNLYNRKNVAAYQYRSDGTIDTIHQFSLLPILGLEIEF